MADATCPDCGGEVIGPIDLDTVSGGTGGEVHLKVTQTSGMIRTPTRAQVRGLLCTDCGRVDLRADPREIAGRWREGER